MYYTKIKSVQYGTYQNLSLFSTQFRLKSYQKRQVIRIGSWFVSLRNDNKTVVFIIIYYAKLLFFASAIHFWIKTFLYAEYAKTSSGNFSAALDLNFSYSGALSVKSCVGIVQRFSHIWLFTTGMALYFSILPNCSNLTSIRSVRYASYFICNFCKPASLPNDQPNGQCPSSLCCLIRYSNDSSTNSFTTG